jgi:hypothetical protein
VTAAGTCRRQQNRCSGSSNWCVPGRREAHTNAHYVIVGHASAPRLRSAPGAARCPLALHARSARCTLRPALNASLPPPPPPHTHTPTHPPPPPHARARANATGRSRHCVCGPGGALPAAPPPAV